MFVYDHVSGFPSEEKYNLTGQIKRSIVSIPSNITERCRGSNKELIQYLNIALGSSFELETQLEIAHRLEFLQTEDWEILNQKLGKLQRRINAFRTSIKRKRISNVSALGSWRIGLLVYWVVMPTRQHAKVPKHQNANYNIEANQV